MDARIDPALALGLVPGDAHVLRNAGGLVTDDVVRSLAISQHALGTREVMVVQHTKCGMHGLDENALALRIEAAAGTPPNANVRFGAFTDLETQRARFGGAAASVDVAAPPGPHPRVRVRGRDRPRPRDRLTQCAGSRSSS